MNKSIEHGKKIARALGIILAPVVETACPALLLTPSCGRGVAQPVRSGPIPGSARASRPICESRRSRLPTPPRI
jgi:hypothetical protein